MDFLEVTEMFWRVYEEGDWICSGGCPKGADYLAKVLSDANGIPIIEYEADWKKYGRGAGLIRNSDIAEKSDILIACVAEDRRGGTEDTIRKFEKKGTKAIIV